LQRESAIPVTPLTGKENVMNARNTNPASQGRHDRLIKERNHDPYKSQKKLPEATLCPDCKSVFSGGRWQWLDDTTHPAQEALCPACRRIHEKVPAGILTVSGEFFQQHRDEIFNLLHNRVEAEKAQHPLKRLMGVEDQDDGSVVITFTDTHMPRDIGQALAHAYQGTIDIHYAEDEDLTRVNWTR
jgi:hypothetical protein